MQDTRTLMNDVFEALYNQDAQVLGEIIKSYGYKIDLEEEDTDSKIENKGTEEDKTEDYGKKYIENIVQNKDSQKALEITELFRMNQLIPDGEETVVALSKTNFEQLIDTIMTEVGAEDVFKEVKKQYIHNHNAADTDDILYVDLGNIEAEVKNMLTIENLKDEIKKQAKKSLKKEVKELNEKIKTLNEKMPEVRLRGGDDKNYCKFDDRIKLSNFDYEKEMNAVYVDRIEVMVGNKKIFTLKEKK